MNKERKLLNLAYFLGGFLSALLLVIFLFVGSAMYVTHYLKDFDLNTEHTFDLNANPEFVQALSIINNVTYNDSRVNLSSKIIFTGNLSTELKRIHDENDCSGTLYYNVGRKELWCSYKECIEGGFCKEGYMRDLLEK